MIGTDGEREREREREIQEKVDKYLDIFSEWKQLWIVKETVILIVIGALETVLKGLERILEESESRE